MAVAAPLESARHRGMKSWTWVVLLGGLVTLCWFALGIRASSQERRWKEFVEKWEARGESFGVEENLPVELPEAQEFVAHSWVHAIAAGESASLARLEKMKPASIDGYEAWQDSVGEDGIFPTMPDDLAERVRLHGQDFQTDLAAFAEALDRPGYRVSIGKPGGGWNGSAWVKELTSVYRLLDALSHAAIARNDSASFTRFTVMELRAGEKLRGSNLLLGLVVGTGFETRAYRALGSIPASRKWPDAEMVKWIAALDFRSRPPAEEFAAALRVERGLYLEMIGEMEKSAVTRKAISKLPANQRYYLAQAKLALCGELEETVLSDGGKPQTTIDPAKWKQFGDDMAARKDESAAEELGHAIFFITRGIFEAVVLEENDRSAIRSKLENELRSRLR